MLNPALENNLCVLIKKRRYSAALHNVAVIPAAVAAKLAALRIIAGTIVKQKAAPELHVPEPLVLLRQNYYGLGGGVGFCAFCFPPSGCPWP